MWAAAATRNAAEMVKILLSKGADVKPRAKFTDWPSQITSEPRAQYHAYGGLTALLYAARGGCLGCVDALIGAGADLNVPTPEGVTALMVALDNNHNDVAKLLIDRGANPHVWDVYGRTALYIAVDRKAAAGAAAGVGEVSASRREGANVLTFRVVERGANVARCQRGRQRARKRFRERPGIRGTRRNRPEPRERIRLEADIVCSTTVALIAAAQ
jgi:hypothetical protein